MTPDSVLAILTDLQRDLRRSTEAEALGRFITRVEALPAGSRPTGVLLASWLAQARANGRDLPDVVADAVLLLRLVAPDPAPTPGRR